jgi:hypothetical protein
MVFSPAGRILFALAAWALFASGTMPAEAATAAAGPVISAISVATPVINVRTGWGIPRFNITYVTGPSGLNNISLTLSSPGGTQQLGIAYFPGLGHSAETAKLGNTEMSAFSKPGLWRITALQAEDAAGNVTSLTQTQIDALVGTKGVLVQNPGPVSVTAPRIDAGRIVTPSVSAGSAAPFARFALAVTAPPDGVSSVSLGLTGLPEDVFFSNLAPSFATKGVVSLALNVKSLPPGTYTVYAASLCSHATCTNLTSAQIAPLFNDKTSLVVTP